MVPNAGGKISQIRGKADLHALSPEGKADRVGRIVRNRKRRNLDIAHLESFSRSKNLQPLQSRTNAVLIAQCPRPHQVRRTRHENRNFEFPGKRPQAINVIRMLMRDEDRGEQTRVFVERLQALEGLATRNPGIDQDFRLRSLYNRGVAVTTAGQHRNRDSHRVMSAAYSLALWNRE